MNKKGLKFDNKSSMVSSWFHKQKMTYARRCSVNHGHRRDKQEQAMPGTTAPWEYQLPAQTRPAQAGKVSKPQCNTHSSCPATSQRKIHPSGGSPELGRQTTCPAFLPGCSPPSQLAPSSQSLGNMKFLGPFCSLKTDDFAKRPLHPSGMSHVSTGTDTPAGPASITQELEAAGPPPAAWQRFSPPKTRALRSPWPHCLVWCQITGHPATIHCTE